MDEAILWLIDKIKAGSKRSSAQSRRAPPLLDWWREKRDFTGTDGKPHTVAVVGGEAAAEIEGQEHAEEGCDPTWKRMVTANQSTDAPTKALANSAITLYDTGLPTSYQEEGQRTTGRRLPGESDGAEPVLMKIVGAEYGDLPTDVGWNRAAPQSSSVPKALHPDEQHRFDTQ